MLARGAATSTSGQACNEAVIFDFARFPSFEPEIDPSTRTAHVAPGTVLDHLNAAASHHGLRFGPDPSTHSRCTVGGMIGNNACGAHSIRYGKTVDNVDSLEIVLYDGTRLTVGMTSDDELAARCTQDDREGELYRSLRNIRDTYGDAIRSTFPVLPRRVSGYNLDQLLPEHGFHVARAFVGTEGTCGLILGAHVTLVDQPKAVCLAVLGFVDMCRAADCVPSLLGLNAMAIEGMDGNLVAAYRSRNPLSQAPQLLPAGDGWLLVEADGANSSEAQRSAENIVRTLRSQLTGAAVITDPRAFSISCGRYEKRGQALPPGGRTAARRGRAGRCRRSR